MIKHYNIPIFVPELACPFRCAFCNQEKISGQKKIPYDKEIIETIENHLSSFREKNRKVNIAFFGGSFTGIPLPEQEHYLKLAQPYIKSGEINAVRLSTRPDYINDEILGLLRKYHVETIELGAQSLDDEVLKKSFRGHTVKQVEDAARLIVKRGFKLGLQMMIGLPGDTLEKSIATARKIISLGAENTRIYPALVIKDTPMHRWYEQGKYIPLSLGEALNITKQLIPIFEQAGLNVIRVGLHPSEGLISGDELIAGPFHVSFKELVLTDMWSDKLNFLKNGNKKGKLEIIVPKSEINYAIGYRAKNKINLLKYYKTVRYTIGKEFCTRLVE
ncbi:MAG: radical SAM protein [Chlorobi bacterium]|nr:radical SAM protein [Chlorobiota bacterium]